MGSTVIGSTAALGTVKAGTSGSGAPTAGTMATGAALTSLVTLDSSFANREADMGTSWRPSVMISVSR